MKRAVIVLIAAAVVAGVLSAIRTLWVWTAAPEAPEDGMLAR